MIIQFFFWLAFYGLYGLLIYWYEGEVRPESFIMPTILFGTHLILSVFESHDKIRKLDERVTKLERESESRGSRH